MTKAREPGHSLIGQALDLSAALKALHFYADPASWWTTGTGASLISGDAGTRARQALGIVGWHGQHGGADATATHADHWIWVLRATADMLDLASGEDETRLGARALRAMAESAEALLARSRSQNGMQVAEAGTSGFRRFPDAVDPDEDGYPAEERLVAIRDANDVAGAAPWLLETFPGLVHSLPAGECEITDGRTQLGTAVRRLRYWTGGWSGQESLIAAVQFGLPGRLFMQSWKRGGEFIFEVRTSLLRTEEHGETARTERNERNEY